MSAAGTVEPLSVDTVIVGALSCMVFLVVIVVLLVALCREDPLCCGDRGYRGPHPDAPPQYHSRASLIGCAENEHSAVPSQPPGRPFIVGKPDDYHLPGPWPRLPSYESVRKKDRQRHVHALIARRFGLRGSRGDCEQSPPSYEETLHQSLDFSPLDLQPLHRHLPADDGNCASVVLIHNQRADSS